MVNTTIAPPEPTIKLATIVAITLAAVHLVLALWFAQITPYRQKGRILSSRGAPAIDIGNPDERQHANYIRHLANGDGFPIFSPTDPQLGEDYQFHQPPLYYLIAAGWAKIFGASDVETAESGTKLRALNAVIGAGNVFLVFCLGSWGFRRTAVGICAAAFAACLPMNVGLSSSIGNDPLLFLFCTAALAFSALSIWSGWSTRNALIVGLSAGLALLTKTTALALLPAILAAVLLSGENKPKATQWAAALGPMILLPIGWWLRNQSLYGDPFAMKAFNQAFVMSPKAQPFIDALGPLGYFLSWVGWWTLRSFYGAFGYMDIWLNETGLPTGNAPNLLYRLLIMATFLAFLGWLASFRLQTEKAARSVQWMNLLFAFIVFVLFIQFNRTYFQAQARYILPAIGPIACGFALGTLYLAKNRWVLALAALLVIFGGTTIYAGIRLPSEFQKRVSDV